MKGYRRKGKRPQEVKPEKPKDKLIAKPPLFMQAPGNFSEVKTDLNLFSEEKIEGMSDVLDSRIIRQLREYLQFTRFTKIQNESMIPIIERKDVLLKSTTGSGKTVGFLIPILQQLINLSKNTRINRKDGMRVLIVSPTRELSTQTYNVLEKICRPLPFLTPGLIIGGTSMKSEKTRLRKGIVLVIGTPGRILYHLKNTATFKPTHLQTIVLDEADKLLDMGFENQIREIYEITKPIEKKIQTLLVSATLSEKVREMSSWCLSAEKVCFVGEEMEKMSVPSTLKQFYVQVNPKMRFVTLVSFLISKCHSEFNGSSSNENEDGTSCKILIFFSNCVCVDFYYAMLKKLGIFENNSIYSSVETPIHKLHGKMEQVERSLVFKNFVSAKTGILLTTDVLCRGIDLPRTEWVVQFDAPGQPFDYLHRIGRTSRIGKEGNALLFLMEHEMPYLKMLQKFKFEMIELTMQKMLEYLVSIYPNDKEFNGFKFGKNLQRRIESIVKEDPKMMELSKNAIIDFLRAYSTHGKNLKFIFHTKFLNVGKICGSFGINSTPTEIFGSNKYQNNNFRNNKKNFGRDRKVFGSNRGGNRFQNRNQNNSRFQNNRNNRDSNNRNNNFQRRNSNFNNSNNNRNKLKGRRNFNKGGSNSRNNNNNRNKFIGDSRKRKRVIEVNEYDFGDEDFQPSKKKRRV